MDSFIWIAVMIFVLAAIVGLALVLAWKHRTGKLEQKATDYKAFFLMGLVWIIIGVAFTFMDYSMTFFLPMGVVFLALGLANRDKWGKKEPMGPEYRKNLMIRVAVGIVALALGVAVLLLMA
jgi:hypothetical protein